MKKYIGVKKFVPFLSVALMLCLFSFVLPPPVLGSPAHMVTAQEPVTKNGFPFADVELFTDHNAFATRNNKITTNNAEVDVLYYGAKVGSFVFNKHNSYIEIEITEHVAVDVVWYCSKDYASCTLKGEGVYRLPQLLQDNGKTESFDGIWIQRVDVHDPTDLPDFIEGSIAAMAEMYPGATDRELDQVRAQWAEQISLKMERIKETNGAVLTSNPTTRATAYINIFLRVEDFGGGSTTNPRYVLGYPDGTFARFYTPGANQTATVVGTTLTLTKGDVYAIGYRSTTSTGQYAIVYASTTGGAEIKDWPPIGYTKISTTPTNSADHYVGYAGTAYQYLAVGCNTYMGGAATYNDFYLDSVKIVG